MIAFSFMSAYLKTTGERDAGMLEMTKNMNDVEILRAEVKTLPQLGEFSQNKNIKLKAVGIGEVKVSDTGEVTVIKEDGYVLARELIQKEPKLFIAELGGDIPNSKITTVVMIE